MGAPAPRGSLCVRHVLTAPVLQMREGGSEAKQAARWGGQPPGRALVGSTPWYPHSSAAATGVIDRVRLK